jgi:hypothetical protein
LRLRLPVWRLVALRRLAPFAASTAFLFAIDRHAGLQRRASSYLQRSPLS